jgi:hypothetical protein
MECGEIFSRGCDDDSVAAVPAEVFGGAVEASRSSHVRFSSCNLETLVSSLLVGYTQWMVDRHTARVLPPAVATFRRLVYSSGSAS